MERKFLYLVVVLIVLVIAAGIAYQIDAIGLMRKTMVPKVPFVAQPAAAPNAYAQPAMWIARPDRAENPAMWVPEGFAPGKNPPAAVFFIHPTSYLDTGQWNAPLDNAVANARAATFLRGQASAFNEVGAIWAPRYRQATFGAFLTSEQSARQALALAYGDVLAAFDRFVLEVGPERPIILAGHSQGALHLTNLLKDRIAGQPIARRIVAAYVVGWPVSKPADLPALGLPECRTADQTGCILSWQTFAEPADPALLFDTFDQTTGFNGQPRAGTPVVCTNPITGNAGDSAPASANLGTLLPSEDLTQATLAAGQVPARCDGRGILLIGAPPEMGNFVLPGNNYHVFDYSLFWANVRRDAAQRMAAFAQ
ncbi:DUF3089 domain-containing protein [Sphingomonas sp. 37zxx]|uniref:DUF3089 domain-containing protein n=1 Tax=Sphingomonas sp. 37zxx TaxID=1550073 RepID=UPI00053BDF93|nr:DUF3089 domain-containing protein [Sphingomonas sp. 37zxx]